VDGPLGSPAARRSRWHRPLAGKVFDAERPETTLPFISVTGSSFVELFVGTTGHSATAMPAGEPAPATRT
jgi:hypothetical protein